MPETKRLHHFTLTKYALEAVKNGRLKAAELDKANDPYELLPFRRDDFSTEMSLDFQSLYAKEIKFVCFSETDREPSLWGHYADKCRGICLGFDIEPNFMQKMFYKIKYIQDRLDIEKPVISELTKEDTNKGYHDIRLYKSHHWQHENEWRMYISKDSEELLKLDATTSLYFLNFNFNYGFGIVQILKLREILIGFRCEEENIESRFQSLINDDNKYPNPKPAIIRTRLSPSSFEIEKAT